MNILFFDTETTGIPDWKVPSDSEHQPHMVQLAALLYDDEKQNVMQEIDLIIRPDGWVIPDEVVDIHGINTEYAARVGIPEQTALQVFIDLWRKCDLRVAHNTTFDNRIIRIALKRYMPDAVPDEVWKDRDLFCCTLQRAKKLMGGNSGHTLAEAYAHFTGGELTDGHSARADTEACMELYLAMRGQEAEAA